ncbi:MAG: MerR family transcriptional regulator [Fimbriimonadaceae bacterium]|nr:MerR family transcriptional regulator [Fimbriimonadaceae bacterium]
MAGKRQRSNVEVSVSIGAASKITGVEVHTLRYWEQEFPGFLTPDRTPGGQRRYRPADIQAVLVLNRLLREEMYSIAGARKHLRASQARAA